MCGAPGGKSLHIADKLAGTGEVLVRDLTEQKILLVEDNTLAGPDLPISGLRCGTHWGRSRPWDEQADIVIADLPCSGLGIIGRKPDIKYQVTKEDLEELAELQRDILSVVWKYVKPGGKLILQHLYHRSSGE
ncbi:MAG: hypothetical protein ACLUD2_17820 [Clostridium sp.]